MRKIVLFSLTACILIASCDKTVKQPLVYTVTNDALATNFNDVYLPDSGTYNLSALVKFMSGYPNDSVKLVFSGFPKGISVAPDTFSAIPTYTENFTFYTKNMPHGVYPVILTAYTPTQFARTYNFNLVVVPANISSLFYGSLSDSNACTGRNYKFSATGLATSNPYELTINNFGGYGTNVNVNVFFNLLDNTLTIPNQVAGNGSTVSGSGTFTESTMVINYTATSTPTNPAETCTSVYSK